MVIHKIAEQSALPRNPITKSDIKSKHGARALVQNIERVALNSVQEQSKSQAKQDAARPTFGKHLLSTDQADVGNRYSDKTKGLGSSEESINSFKNKLENSQRPLVKFPPCARGDMNVYKYIAFLDENVRPLTVFEYIKNPKAGSENECLNHNVDIIKQHLNSLGEALKEGGDYILLTLEEFRDLKREFRNPPEGGGTRISYQDYDNLISDKGIRETVHNRFRADITSDSKIKSYLEGKSLPHIAEKNQIRENKLVIININKRVPAKEWNPRNYRHATPDAANLKGLVNCIFDAKKEIDGEKGWEMDICFSGGEFNKRERRIWKEYGAKKGVEVHFLNDMAKAGLNQIQRRETLFALCDRYKSTIYIGTQSGSNEDVTILPRTNVYSLSENLDKGQVGISRVEARSQIDIIKRGPLGIPMTASVMGNFYSLRNNEFLTTEGILAAIQVNINPLCKQHLSLGQLADIYSIETGGNISDISSDRDVDRFFEIIRKSANVEADKIKDENLGYYRGAIRSIARRVKVGTSRLSAEAAKYFTDVMRQELSPHDSHDPLTRHELKREAHNANMKRFHIRKISNRLTNLADTDDNYFDSLYL